MDPTASAVAVPRHGHAYDIFILVLTILSLVIMVLLLLPWDQATLDLLTAYDNFICVVFLIDFVGNLAGSKPKSDYFIKRRGWLDLIGSIPSLGFLRLTGLLRLARLSRLARITRLLGGSNRKELVQDVLQNRGQYAAFITVLSAFIVLVTASLLVIQFESQSEDANIKTGGDALWWGLVTITTVGYGDRFPVTGLGRLTGVAVMFAGVGIIGALASILASLLVPPPEPSPGDDSPATLDAPAIGSAAIQAELADIKAELAALRTSLGRDDP